MGFGIRVPGIRISTRGIRVGPRFANVGVSRRGISASAGPRIAKVRVSNRGVGFNTGLGPVRVGTGGARVGGRVGPVRASVGSRGLVLGISAGPIYAGTKVGATSSRSSGQSGLRSVTSNPASSNGRRQRVNFESQYENYKKSLSESGATRRTRNELMVAGVHALMIDLSPYFVVAQEFSTPKPQLSILGQLPNWAWAKSWQVLEGQQKVLHRPEGIPLQFSKTTAGEMAVSELSKEGIIRPVHPAIKKGYKNECVPSMDLVIASIYEIEKSEFGSVQKFFTPGKFKSKLNEVAEHQIREITKEEDQWKTSLAVFQRTLAERIELIQTKREREITSIQKQVLFEDELVAEHSHKLLESMSDIYGIVNDTYQEFLRGDATITTIVLQTCFSDNGGTAAPVGIDGHDLLVVMVMPEASEVIWPEKLKTGEFVSATKKTKSDIDFNYEHYLLCHAAGTIKEAFQVQPALNNVKVIVLDESDEDLAITQRKVRGCLTMSRSQARELLDLSTTGIIKEALHYYDSWMTAQNSGRANEIFSLTNHWVSYGNQITSGAVSAMLSTMGSVRQCFESYVSLPNKSRPTLASFTNDEANSESDVEITSDLSNDDLDVFSVPASSVFTNEFWIYAALIAEDWDNDEVDFEEAVRCAEEMTIFLSPPTTSLMRIYDDWTTRFPKTAKP
jgi:hypothetical protein